MRPSLLLRAAQGRTPLIKFLGKRSPPKSVDSTPQAHPASPTHSLPDSFSSYRSKAQQHGPLGGQQHGFSSSTSPHAYGAIGGHSGEELGPIQPKEGEFFDRDDLPKRFRRTVWTEEECEAVSSGGASLYG